MWLSLAVLLLYYMYCIVSEHAQERAEDKEGSKEKRKRDSPPPVASVKEVETKVGMQSVDPVLIHSHGSY